MVPCRWRWKQVESCKFLLVEHYCLDGAKSYKLFRSLCCYGQPHGKRSRPCQCLKCLWHYLYRMISLRLLNLLAECSPQLISLLVLLPHYFFLYTYRIPSFGVRSISHSAWHFCTTTLQGSDKLNRAMLRLEKKARAFRSVGNGLHRKISWF